jgi:hypothetical protein
VLKSEFIYNDAAPTRYLRIWGVEVQGWLLRRIDDWIGYISSVCISMRNTLGNRLASFGAQS